MKAQAAEHLGLLTVSAPASLGSAATTDQVCAQILRSVLEALLLGARAHGSGIDQSAPFSEASQLARIYQTTTGRSGGGGAFGMSASAGSSDTLVTPSTATPSVVIPDLLPRDYFLDLSRLDPHDDSAFFIPGITRFESRGKRRSILARDSTVRSTVDKVTPPRLLFAGSALLGIADAKGLWLDHTLLIVIALIIVAGLATRRICSGPIKS